MKNIFLIASFLITLSATAQVPRWKPANPDSVKISVLNAGVVNQVAIGDLITSRVTLTKHTADSAAQRALINGNTTNITSNTSAIALKLDSNTVKQRIHDSLNLNATVIRNSKTVAPDSLMYVKSANEIVFKKIAATGGTSIISLDTLITLSSEAPIKTQLNALGSPIKSITVGLSYFMPSSYGRDLYTGDVYLVAQFLIAGQVITGAKVPLYTGGNYISSGYNGVELYSKSGTTLSLVASSVADSTIWKAASGTVVTKAFSSTYTVPATGIYYIGIQFNDNYSPTIRPQIVNVAQSLSTVFNVMNFTNSGFITANYASAGSTPSATISAASVSFDSADPIWAATY
jgi:hypothetical protein